MTAGRTVNSLTQEWCTPKVYVEAVRKAFNDTINLDPCSNDSSIVNAEVEYKLPEQDGLRLSWQYKTIYVNPPYGADKLRGTTIRDWLYKCAEANKEFGSEVLALIPVATNTGHWKNYIWGKAAAICFLYDTRLKFLINGNDQNKGSPMSCSMIYWGNDYNRFLEVFIEYGAVVDIRSLRGKRIGKHFKIIQPTYHCELGI